MGSQRDHGGKSDTVNGADTLNYALYGTYREYCAHIAQEGICRSTAAYFLLPEHYDADRLRTTLICSIFHAIGLHTMNHAIRNRLTLAEAVEAKGGACLLLLPFERTVRDPELLDTYQYRGAITYPYGKVINIGPVSPPIASEILIPSSMLDLTIHANDSEIPQKALRFFQKSRGKTQFLGNCSIQNIEIACVNAAKAVAPALQHVLNCSSERSADNHEAN